MAQMFINFYYENIIYFQAVMLKAEKLIQWNLLLASVSLMDKLLICMNNHSLINKNHSDKSENSCLKELRLSTARFKMLIK